MKEGYVNREGRKKNPRHPDLLIGKIKDLQPIV